MLLDANDCQLVLVDYQQRLMPSIHEAEAVLARAVQLARIAQLIEVPLWATEQNPAGLGPTVAPLQSLVAGRVLAKMEFCAASVLLPTLRPAAKAPQGNARSRRRASPATRAACPSTCRRRRRPRRRARASCWPAARPTSACCRPRSRCWRKSSTCGS